MNFTNVSGIAFSMACLARNQAVPVALDFGFQVLAIQPGTSQSREDSSSTNKLRLRSVASGKAQVKMHGQNFKVSSNGMFKVGPGVNCVTMNLGTIDATLHVSVLPEDLCARQV